MPVDISKQVRYWRDRSPYPGASSSHHSRNSTETNKPVEPVQPSTRTRSSEYTRNATHQHDSEGLVVMASYFQDKRDPEPVATCEPQTNTPMNRSVSWTPESSPAHQKAMKERVRSARSRTLPSQREQELHNKIVRVLSASTQTHPDARNRPRLRIEIPERPASRIVEQTGTQIEDGIRAPHTTPTKAWIQLDDGIRSPRMVEIDPSSYRGASFMTAMVVEPEQLDCMPPLRLGCPAIRPFGASFQQVSSHSNGSSPESSKDDGRNSSAEEQDTRSEDSFTFVDDVSTDGEGVQLVDELGSGESKDEEEDEHEAYEEDSEAHQQEADEEESDEEDGDDEAQDEKMVWYRADPCCRCDNCCPIKRMGRPRDRCLNAERVPLSDALRRESDMKYNLGLKVFLGILVVLFLVLGANFHLASWENAIAKGKYWRSRS
ncbi:hypothetical protein CkaCkLH20_02535 [Colletotrichum karsti]|uniref:Uncharacterized protein n=1 Tax=Colletotrichum karsti TaxID=1095194 RepID=A0A9P6IBE3_9PEZI|nr:uncharacterized protein CkaCkLH20_02535 [Colletotrichum karsti]KAF9879724.1 hypothetical protein CkaCkLH20_02535 [Colletotrichum karsti]